MKAAGVAGLLRRSRERLTWLQQGVDALPLAHDAPFMLGDPAFDAMRKDPRFQALEQRLQQRRERGRAAVDALRQASRVPRRG